MQLRVGEHPSPPPDDHLAALRSVALEHAASWFPELDGRPLRVDVRTVSTRPRGTLLVLTIRQGHVQRRAMAKLRHDDKRRSAAVVRPGLVPPPLPAATQAALEYEGLCGIHRMVDPTDPCLGAVRPLEHIPGMSGVVTEYLEASPGRRALVSATRVGALLAGGHRRLGPALLRHAGVWLRVFHGTSDDYRLTDRVANQDELAALFVDFEVYLTERVGAPAGALARRAGARVPALLSTQLPLAVGHGDFAARNTMIDRRGRVYVIDPMPRWRTPVFEDLARFLVGLRLHGLQVHSHGLAYGRGYLDAREQDFLAGYFGDRPIGARALHAYMPLVLLDKWSALTSQRMTSGRGVARARAAWADQYVLREGHRLLGLIEDCRS